MKRPIAVLVIAIVVLVALGISVSWWFQHKYMPVVFTEDAVQVIANHASELFEKNPSAGQDEIDRLIKSLHDASVINLQNDSDGKAVDQFGMAFRVENRTQDGNSITTVTSAGSDGEFGTQDDIQFTHESVARSKEPHQL